MDCNFYENVLFLILDNDFVLVNNIIVIAKVVPKNVGESSRVQNSIEKFLKGERF